MGGHRGRRVPGATKRAGTLYRGLQIGFWGGARGAPAATRAAREIAFILFVCKECLDGVLNSFEIFCFERGSLHGVCILGRLQ